ncbi:MAG: hypothetical protein MI922_22045 [Bacteroidales bacterium]|nr:hypothetical protein [Bacteroidales bacterium]
MNAYKIILITISIFTSSITFSQQSNYDVSAGNGNGIRFWSNDNYKIHMGAAPNYKYGPVTDYSIKMNMNDNAARGWTWGIVGQPPIAALNTLGTMQLDKDLRVLGNIGIGTDEPNSKLDIVGNGITIREQVGLRNGDAQLFNHTGATNGFMIRPYDESFEGGTWNWNSDFGYRNDSKNWYVETDFAVGTTQTNGYNLAVNGSIGATSLTLSESGIPTNGDVKLYNHIGQTYGFLLRPYDESFEGGAWNWNSDFGYRNETKNWYVETSFAIGTTNPGNYRLAVEGTIGAREIKVHLDAWSDFVFNSDYDLMNLEEVESFISKNNRLPDIPSESDVIESGVNLGEMDAKLLQKIEELTLYMIDMNKEVKSLRQENESLKAKIDNLESLK